VEFKPAVRWKSVAISKIVSKGRTRHGAIKMKQWVGRRRLRNLYNRGIVRSCRLCVSTGSRCKRFDCWCPERELEARIYGQSERIGSAGSRVARLQVREEAAGHLLELRARDVQG